MKRSNAPSAAKCLNKRPCFTTPFKSSTALPSGPSRSPPVGGNEDTNKITACLKETTPKLVEASICWPSPKPTALELSKTTNRLDSSAHASVCDNNGAGTLPHYFSVVWGKLSKKKHKKWEGDAVLVISGKTITLLDMEGKEIARSNNSGSAKQAHAGSLTDGDTMIVGGKEVEITGTIEPAAFASGACFNSLNFARLRDIQNICAGSEAKSFRSPCPFAATSSEAEECLSGAIVKPRHDPTVPGALVLPRPSLDRVTSKITAVVDVVVDPHVAHNLRPHQRAGVVFLYECIMGMRNFAGRGAILADEMGLGKTLQVIALIWTLLKQGPFGGKPVIKRVLIVTPGSLVKNWNREFRKWLGTERISVYCVDAENKAKEFSTMPLCPVMIISYEMLIRCIEEIKGISFGLLVCDEGHRLKNSSIKTTSMLAQLDIVRRIILTGTPVQNDLQEFFSLVDFCNPNILGSSASFRRLFEQPIVESKQPGCSREAARLGEDRAAELARLTAAFVLRRTSDLNEAYLLPKVEYTVFCRPSDAQDKQYRALISACVASGSAFLTADCAQHLQWISKLRKLCNHPYLLSDNEERGDYDDGTVYDGDAESTASEGLTLTNQGENVSATSARIGREFEARLSGKCAVLQRMLAIMHQGCVGDRIVLVSNYTQTLDLLGLMCDMHGYRYSRLDGRTPMLQRQQVVEHFNNTKASAHTVFLLSSKAGGVGLNLTGANRLVLFDTDWNPANDLQAMARIWRDGQRKSVHIYRLLTVGTIEEKMYQRQLSKLSIGRAVTDHASLRRASSSLTFSVEELKDLFSYRSSEETNCDTHDLLDCDCCKTADESIHLMAASRSGAARRKHMDLSTSEVTSWQHVPSSHICSSIDDKLLQAVADIVTFVFVNRQYHLGQAHAAAEA